MRFIEQLEEEHRPSQTVGAAELHAALRAWPREEGTGYALSPSAEKDDYARRMAGRSITMQRAALHGVLHKTR